MTILVKFSLSNICVKYTGKLISRNGIFVDFMPIVKMQHVCAYAPPCLSIALPTSFLHGQCYGAASF
jgi:hypothetical protein